MVVYVAVCLKIVIFQALPQDVTVLTSVSQRSSSPMASSDSPSESQPFALVGLNSLKLSIVVSDVSMHESSFFSPNSVTPLYVFSNSIIGVLYFHYCLNTAVIFWCFYRTCLCINFAVEC